MEDVCSPQHRPARNNSGLSRASVYTERLDDRKAVYLTQASVGVHADGTSDDTEAIQHAIDKVQEKTGEVSGRGDRYEVKALSYGLTLAGGGNPHAADEYVEIDSLVTGATTLLLFVAEWCGVAETV
jgi:acetylornithine deacetylase/succinyl-diaminopimelate desuccinylase-like protein